MTTTTPTTTALVSVRRPRVRPMVHTVECPAAKKAIASGHAFPRTMEEAVGLVPCGRCLKGHTLTYKGAR